MNIIPFLNCLNITGINTGTSVLGMYSLNSGDSLVSYNQIFSTGVNYFSGIPYDAAFPLIYNSSGHQPSGNLNGSQFYQISYQFNKDFTSIIYLNYSGCLYTGSKNLMLVSTVQNPSTTSGVYMGITPSNRLFIQTPDYSYTIAKEIGVNDFVFLNISQDRFINFGLFSMADNLLYSKSHDEGSSILNVNELCLGGALNYPNNFTGYSGKINEMYLFSGSLNTSSIGNCVTCSFVTGYSQTQSYLTYTGVQITGSFWSGVKTTQVTGSKKVLAPYPEWSGGQGFVYIDSGVSGLVTSSQSLVPQYQVVLYSGLSSGVSFTYNTAQMMNGMLFNFYFDLALTSGDIVEIHTYPLFNNGMGLSILNGEYPISNQVVQLFGNGLAETLNVDYSVAFNNLILGFDSSDNLQYDIYPNTFTFSYTTPPILTGSPVNSGVVITGVSGQSNFFTNIVYDIFLNGQKMSSGINYSYSGQNLIVSGNDLLDINDNSGDFLEIKFIPVYSGTMQSVFQITGTQSYIYSISGFSEQIWVNGVRQLLNNDYFKTPSCTFYSGFFDFRNYPFTLYDGE